MGKKKRRKGRRVGAMGRSPKAVFAAPAPPWVDRRSLLAAAGVALLAAGLYAPSVGYEFTDTDDRVLIHDHAHFVTQIGNVSQVFSRTFFPRADRSDVYYRPLVTLSLMLDAQWSGTGPRAYHVSNLIFHGLASGLLLLLLLRMRLELALGGAALFAVHPALTEAVVWIPGRCDTLLAVFVLLSLLAFLRHLESGSLVALVAHALLWGCALLTKESAIVVPALALAWVVLVADSRAVLRSPLLWGAWAAVGLAWLWAWSTVDPVSPQPLATRLTALVVNLPVLLMHLGKILVPHDLSVLAVAPDTSWLTGAVALVPTGIAIWWLRGRRRQLLLWGLGCFLLFLLPTLLASTGLILENRLYLPTIGVLVGLVALGSQLLEARPTTTVRASLAVAAGVAVAGLALISWRYAEAFRNPDTFTAAAVLGSPHSPLAHLNRGIVYHRRGEMQPAEAEYDKALELNQYQPVVHNNLGLVYMRRGELQRAEQAFRQEIALNDAYSRAHFNLALVLRRTQRIEQAAEAFRQSLRRDPDNVETLQELFAYATWRGQQAEAARYARELRRRSAEPRAPSVVPQPVQ